MWIMPLPKENIASVLVSEITVVAQSAFQLKSSIDY